MPSPFVKGNKLGQGNPQLKHLAQLRRDVNKALGGGALARVMAKMVALAEDGDVQAAKLCLAYGLGQPKQEVELSGAGVGPALVVLPQWAGGKAT